MFAIHRFALLITVTALGFGVGACGAADDSSSTAGLSIDAAAGKTYLSTHCLGCHTIDGKNKTGPTFKALAGSMVTLESGATVTADTAYLVKSIRDPQADIVKGYSDVMASAIPKDSVSEEQAQQIVAYLQTLH